MDRGVGFEADVAESESDVASSKHGMAEADSSDEPRDQPGQGKTVQVVPPTVDQQTDGEADTTRPVVASGRCHPKLEDHDKHQKRYEPS